MRIQHSYKLGQGEHWPIYTTHLECDGPVNKESLSLAIDYLCSWTKTDLPIAIIKNQEHGAYYPLVFTFSDSETLTEQKLWEEIADSFDDADSLLLKYLQSLESIDSELREELWSDETHHFGLIPIQALFDKMQLIGSESAGLPANFVSAFILYIDQICSFDSETFEDEYITSVLRATRDNDQPSYLKILSIRLLRGQYALDTRTFDYLDEFLGPKESQEEALLRPFIEYSTKHHRDEWLLDEEFPYGLPSLLSAIYGSQASAKEEVLLTLSQLLDFELETPVSNPWMEEAIERKNRTRDYRLKNSKVDLHTGYHRYIKGKKRWVKEEP